MLMDHVTMSCVTFHSEALDGPIIACVHSSMVHLSQTFDASYIQKRY
jgi:hypothetical protein